MGYSRMQSTGKLDKGKCFSDREKVTEDQHRGTNGRCVLEPREFPRVETMPVWRLGKTSRGCQHKRMPVESKRRWSPDQYKWLVFHGRDPTGRLTQDGGVEELLWVSTNASSRSKPYR
mmetsp:Transcript_6496/g.13003  ORF Transcript_6496/g.13003 Transcript_6496/m.13003 type:complete len:118 (-) Transcript_6496:850-1203(-)